MGYRVGIGAGRTHGAATYTRAYRPVSGRYRVSPPGYRVGAIEAPRAGWPGPR